MSRELLDGPCRDLALELARGIVRRFGRYEYIHATADGAAIWANVRLTDAGDSRQVSLALQWLAREGGCFYRPSKRAWEFRLWRLRQILDG